MAADPTAAVNAMVSQTWKRYHTDLAETLRKTLRGYEGKRIPIGPMPLSSLVEDLKVDRRDEWIRGTLEIDRVEVPSKSDLADGLADPPGFHEISADRARIAVPLSTADGDDVPMWDFKVGVVLKLVLDRWTPGSVTDPERHQGQVRLLLKIRELHAVADALFAEQDDRAPKLKQIDISKLALTGELSISAKVCTLFWVRLATLDIQASTRADLAGGTVQLKAATRDDHSDAGLKITVQIYPELKGRIDGTIPLKVGPAEIWRLEIHKPLDGASLGPLPRYWAHGSPGTPLTDPGKSFDFFNPALLLEAAIAKPFPSAPKAAHLAYGQVFDIRYKDPGQSTEKPEAYEGFPDTAIWTGHYLAAEALRYSVVSLTQRVLALARVKEVLDGIQRLFDVTGRPGLLARAALPDSSPLTPRTPFHLANHPSVYPPITIGTEVWRGYGRGEHTVTRDQYVGVMMGLAFAHRLVDDPEVRMQCKELIDEVVGYFNHSGWNIITRNRKGKAEQIENAFLFQWDQRLAFLLTSATANPGGPLAHLYEEAAPAAQPAWLAVWATCTEPLREYYKFNLLHSVHAMLFLQEQHPGRREAYRAGYQVLWNTVKHHQNVYFLLLRILAEPTPEGRKKVRESRLTPSGLTLEEEIRALLQLWLVRLTKVQSTRGLPWMRSPDSAYLTQLFPKLVVMAQTSSAKVDSETGQLGNTRQGFAATFPLPVDRRPGKGMDFLWQRSAFETDLAIGPLKDTTADLLGQVRPSEGNSAIEAPGVDYLLGYWLARYLEVVE